MALRKRVQFILFISFCFVLLYCTFTVKTHVKVPAVNVFIGIQSFWQGDYTANFFVRQMVELYSFSSKYKLTIEIMTNSEYAKQKIEKLLKPIHKEYHTYRISISDEYAGLDFPWGNRRMVKEAFERDAYQYFIITEDDMLLTEEVLDSWILDNNMLAIDKVCRRALQRIEWREEEEYLLDEVPINKTKEFMELVKCKNGKLFYFPLQSYYAMSIYTKDDVKKWMQSSCWNKNGNPTQLETREAAVSGSHQCFEPLCIPIIISNATTATSDEKSFAPHLSNKYANTYHDPATAPAAKIKPNQIWPNYYELDKALTSIDFNDNLCVKIQVKKLN